MIFMDADLTDNELNQEEYKEFQQNAELKAIIAGQNARFRSIDINGVEIKIRSALPKGLRDTLVKIAREYEAGEVESADEQIYEVMSKIAVEDPYTNAAVWKYIDAETGEVPNLMKSMIEKITDLEGAAKRFRR